MKQSFSDVKGTPYRYEHSGIIDLDALAAIQRGADSSSLEFRRHYFPGDISNKIDFLEDLFNRVDLIPTIEPAGTSSKSIPDSQKTFDEKCNHYLRYLYENGGKERKNSDINTLTDFSNALASNAEESYRIIESLLDDNLIRYDKKSVVSGDWANNIQIHYYNVLLTPAGKRAIVEPKSSNQLTKMPSNTFHIGDGAKFHLVQGDGAIQTNASGNAIVNIVKGDNNNQSSHIG